MRGNPYFPIVNYSCYHQQCFGGLKHCWWCTAGKLVAAARARAQKGQLYTKSNNTLYSTDKFYYNQLQHAPLTESYISIPKLLKIAVNVITYVNAVLKTALAPQQSHQPPQQSPNRSFTVPLDRYSSIPYHRERSQPHVRPYPAAPSAARQVAKPSVSRASARYGNPSLIRGRTGTSAFARLRSSAIP